ncbi:MAG TPA: NAD(P)-dependent oxidoreductase [Micrococcales bacterium]|uniref:NAD(P)H-binding protein n=1 Tax=Miniimonas arenae TaxID=676201 RepID=UPI000EDB3415|nr:NAD(P)H-binding protein [Miniimonas arenae]HCX84320.1 NAD(P)-dependent oxidoreductase [Micrococcales bacterium]
MSSSASPGVTGVTGATGHIGGLVARGLDAAGVRQRLLVRDPASPRVPELASVQGVAAVDYADLEHSRASLTGVDVLLLVSAHESPTRVRDHARVIDAAAQAGVRHVVYTSFAGAAPDATFTLARDHHATEEHLRASGMAWTFLRDTLYLDFMEQLAGPDGVIRGPAGTGRVAAVARADVASVATTVLLDPATHAGATYDVTGPEALTLVEVAATIRAVRGTSVTFHDETIEEAYASRASYGAPDWQVDAWVSTYTAIASNVMARPSGDVERLTGVAPLSLEQLLRLG